MPDERDYMEWWESYLKWRSRPDRKMHELSKKPEGFDLWRQGEDALGLGRIGTIPTNGIKTKRTYGRKQKTRKCHGNDEGQAG